MDLFIAMLPDAIPTQEPQRGKKQRKDPRSSNGRSPVLNHAPMRTSQSLAVTGMVAQWEIHYLTVQWATFGHEYKLPLD